MEPRSPRSLRTTVLVGGPGVDGGVDSKGQTASTWRQAEALGRVEPQGAGAGFLAVPDRLLARARDLGVDEVLLRVSWARLEPAESVYDEVEFERVAALCASVRTRGLDVGLVLCDGTLPEWLGPEGWLLPATPKRLKQLGLALCKVVGDLAVVVAVEEPASFVAAGWLLGVAPPFRSAAVLDSLAALDAMLAGAVSLAGALSPTPVTTLASPGILGALEATMLGQPVPPVDPWVVPMLTRAATSTPGRVGREPREALRWPITPVGDELPLPRGIAGLILRRLTMPADRSSLLEISSGVSLRSVAAMIDERGRVSRLRGHLRATRLEELFEAVDAASSQSRLERVVIGELVDRWRWGTYRSREGILGVDRLRGPTGADVLSTDAAGIHAVAALAAVLAARQG